MEISRSWQWSTWKFVAFTISHTFFCRDFFFSVTLKSAEKTEFWPCCDKRSKSKKAEIERSSRSSSSPSPFQSLKAKTRVASKSLFIHCLLHFISATLELSFCLIFALFFLFRWNDLSIMKRLLMLTVLSIVSAQELRNAEQRIETTSGPMVFSNHNVNLNNVGLDDDETHEDPGKKLQGPNVCTKQEA